MSNELPPATIAEKTSFPPPAAVGRRIGASVIDAGLAAACGTLGAGVAVLLAGPCVGPGCEIIFTLGLGGTLGALGLLQAFLLATRGQSIGKRFAGLRVVRADGRPAGLAHGVALRTLPLVLVPGLLFGLGEALWRAASEDAGSSVLVRTFGYSGLSNLLTVAPAAGSALFLLVDAIAAVLPGGRALHDRFADTRVTRASSLEEAEGTS
jgi:uncharacterized RDD family membrane protein YckC